MTMFSQVESIVSMQHTDGRNASYILELKYDAVKCRYNVIATYGRIGTALKVSKIGGFDGLEDARKFFHKKMKQQIGKGYKIIISRL